MGKRIAKLNQGFEQLINSVATATRETDLTEEKKARRRKRADYSEFEFCKIYFPKIFTDEFNALHHHLVSLKSGNYSVGGCRKFGKSAYTFVAKLVRAVAMGQPMLAGIGMATQSDAQERAMAMKRIIESNKLLCYDYNIQVQQERRDWLIINNVQIVGFGVREGLRNLIDDNFKRFKLVILDDLYNRQTVTSEKQNERVIDFYESEVKGQMEPDGLSIWLFNYITATSPGAVIAGKYPDLHFNLPALNDAGQTNWPESSTFTTDYLLNLKATLPYEVWQGDYMNTPALRGNILSEQWLKEVPEKSVTLAAVIIAIDPSHGQSPSACNKGAAVLGITTDLRFILLDIFLRKSPYPELFGWCYQVIERYKPYFKVILFENDFSQWAFAEPYYIQWIAETKHMLPLQSINSKDSKTEFFSSDKFSRIMNLVHPYQTGRLLHSQDIGKTKDYEELLSQYMAFGKATTKLDGLDALATAFIRIMQYVQTGTFSPVTPRRDKTEWLNNI